MKTDVLALLDYNIRRTYFEWGDRDATVTVVAAQDPDLHVKELLATKKADCVVSVGFERSNAQRVHNERPYQYQRTVQVLVQVADFSPFYSSNCEQLRAAVVAAIETIIRQHPEVATEVSAVDGDHEVKAAYIYSTLITVTHVTGV